MPRLVLQFRVLEFPKPENRENPRKTRNKICNLLMYLHEFVADTLRQMAVDACGLASHALGADGQPLELLVELLRIAPVLKCGVRTAVHNAGRDSRDSEREREYDV